MAFDFKLRETCAGTKARLGEIKLDRGTVPTPIFMPVGTLGAVKGVSYEDIKAMDIPITLANTYHLYLRPGTEVLKKLGGLHRFCGWDRPILTDSGGFQVFSLAKLGKITDDGFAFQSHIDGSRHFFTPEKVLEIQAAIGSDIVMPLDECIPFDSPPEKIASSVRRTIAWAKRSRDGQGLLQPHQNLFAIVQGEGNERYREEMARELAELDLPGYAIGGLSVGEKKETLYHMAGFTAEHLPAQKPRYLMGVGAPEDLVECVSRGVDMFDCVLPTRNARNGTVYHYDGKILLRNQEHEFSEEPIDRSCGCFTCRHHTRGYLRHLFKSRELGAYTLATLHNLFFFHRLMADIRAALAEKRFPEFLLNFRSRYRN